LVQKRKIVYDKSPNSKQKIVAARIFLIDGTGALVTAALLSLALARHEALFEMKPDILYFLASLAVGKHFILPAYAWAGDLLLSHIDIIRDRVFYG
jgi:hypothetical protein